MNLPLLKLTRVFSDIFVTIIDGGSGYISAPDVVIDGAGTGMTARAFINDAGEVASVVITIREKDIYRLGIQ